MEIQDVKEGVYDDIEIEKYHRGPGLSSSGIKLLLDCPRKFYNRYVSPAAQVEVKKKHLIKGQAFHTYFLEPETFDDKYHLTEKLRRGTKIYQEAVNHAEALGKEVIFKNELEEIALMAKSLEQVEVAKRAIKDGDAEKSCYWIDGDTKELLRCRPDYYTQNLILDLKTTRSADPSSFGRDVIKYGYHIQAAMYLDGMKKIMGNENMQFIFLAVEGSPDYIAEDFVLDDDNIELGRQLYKSAIKLYQKCKASNHWPTYCKDTSDHVLCAPSWAHEKLEQIQRVVG